jgi:hypothetical protein
MSPPTTYTSIANSSATACFVIITALLINIRIATVLLESTVLTSLSHIAHIIGKFMYYTFRDLLAAVTSFSVLVYSRQSVLANCAMLIVQYYF